MTSYEKLLLENKAWAREKVEEDADFFKRLEHIQTPEFLWVGCSDSRVPANEITGTQPGEVFVHRNIANLVHATDLNFASVLQYAVEVLKVSHIIVCGHYGCGGVKAAMTNHSLGLINKWLRNIKETYVKNQAELLALPEGDIRLNRMVELNVQEQVMNLAKSAVIQKAWKEDRRPHLHDWVYSLSDGIIKPIFEMEAGTPIDPIFQFTDP